MFACETASRRLTNDRVIELLRKAYSDEIETVMNYQTNAIVLDAEAGVISTYRDLIDAAEANDDPVTEDLAVTILADEEAHRTEFRGLSQRVPNRLTAPQSG